MDALQIRTQPQPVVLHRNDIPHEPLGFPYTTAPIVPDVRVERAPNPYPPATLFAGVGRDVGHAPTPLRTWTGGLAVREWLSVMAWPFQAGKSLTPIRLSQPQIGRSNPIRERTIIEGPRATSLGAMTAMTGVGYVSPDLTKIAF